MVEGTAEAPCDVPAQHAAAAAAPRPRGQGAFAPLRPGEAAPGPAPLMPLPAALVGQPLQSGLSGLTLAVAAAGARLRLGHGSCSHA